VEHSRSRRLYLRSFGMDFCIITVVREIGLRFVFFLFFCTMSFSELDELARGLDEPGELPSDSVEARLSAHEAALEKLQEQQTLLVDQQARLLENVTGLAPVGT
jgi:hypothetical protein